MTDHDGGHPEAPPGSQEFGRFRIVRRLPGAGARDLFLASDEVGRHAVLEVLQTHQGNKGLFDPRVASEAASYARLSHPHAVKVLELFSVDGKLVIALEEIDGTTLDLMADATSELPAAEADACWIYVVACVLDALAAAHGAVDADGKPGPVLHRNVNPSNIHITWDGTVKLGNFNFADVVTSLRQSSPGLTWGAAYLAPEQIASHKAGAASDVYSATLVLAELLARRRVTDIRVLRTAQILELMGKPDGAPTPEAAAASLARPSLDPRVLEILCTGLEPDPALRSSDAARARDVLRSAIDVDAARRCCLKALERAHSAHDAPTMAPPALEDFPPPLVPRSPPAHKPAVVPGAAKPAKPPPLTGGERPSLPAEAVELASSALESVHPPASSASPATRASSEATPAAPAEPVATPARPAEPVAGERPRRSGARRVVIASIVAVGACTLAAAVAMRWSAHRAEASTAGAASAGVASAGATPSARSPPSTSETAVQAAAASESATPGATPTPTPSAIASAVPNPVGTTATAELPADQGEIQLPTSAAGHRIYVDGHQVGEGTAPVRVSCGAHTVRIGSTGHGQHVEVPCGQSIALSH